MQTIRQIVGRSVWVASIVAAMGADFPPQAPENPNAKHPLRVAVVRDDFVHYLGFATIEAPSRLEWRLRVRIDDIDRIGTVTATQKDTLILAAREDIQQVLDRVNAARQRFNELRQSFNATVEGQDKLTEVLRDIQQIREEFGEAAFSEGSLFDASITRVLTVDQATKYRTAFYARRITSWRSRVEVVFQSCAKQLGLLDSLLLARLSAPAEEPPEQDVELQNRIVIDVTIDQWFFGVDGDVGAARTRKRFATFLQMWINGADRVCGLTEEQKKKLQLAGRGDIKRVFDRIKEIRQKSQLVGVRKFIDEEFEPLQREFLGDGFGGSLFNKTLRSTLTPEQTAKYETAVGKRRTADHQAAIRSGIDLLNNHMGLGTRRCEKLVQLLLENMKPSRRIGQQFTVVLIQLARLPEAKLRPIFDDDEWRELNGHLQRARKSEQSLKDGGYLAD